MKFSSRRIPALTRLFDMLAWLVWLASRLRTVGTRLSSRERALVLLVPSSTLLVHIQSGYFWRPAFWQQPYAGRCGEAPGPHHQPCQIVGARASGHAGSAIHAGMSLDLAVSLSSYFVRSRWPPRQVHEAHAGSSRMLTNAAPLIASRRASPAYYHRILSTQGGPLCRCTWRMRAAAGC